VSGLPESVHVRLVSEGDVDALVTVELALKAARQTADLVAAGDLTTGRLQVEDGTMWSRILCGILPSFDLLGYKQFHRVGQRVRYHVHLFSRSSGTPLAVVDGRRVTSLRTAATAAVAVAHHRGGLPSRVGVIGSGEEAKEGLRMLAGALPVTSVRVFSPTKENREAFARLAAAEFDADVRAVARPAEALEHADVAYVATSAAGEPFLRGADVKSVDVVAAIGSTRPNQRELFGDVFPSARRVVVDCADALDESGDVLEAVAEFGYDPADAVLLGNDLAVPPRGGDGPVLFKSIGSVEQDLVLAHDLWRAATQRGLGRDIEAVASLRIMR
jgi:alanine dehydrogenase